MTRQPGVSDPPQTRRQQRDFARSFDELEAVFAFVQPLLGERGVAEADAYAILMTIEEFFTNMIKYNAAGTGRLVLEVECGAEGVTCRLSDPDSERWDPTQAPDANIDLPVEQRRPGGLGIHLVRRMVDAIEYEYAGRCSRITFHKRLAAPTAGGAERH